MSTPWKDDFHKAVANRNAEAMRSAIAKGLPINEPLFGYDESFTAFHYAIHEGGGAGVVEVLIVAGADVNLPTIKDGEKRDTPLMMAANNADLPVVKLLMMAGAEVNYSNKFDITPLSQSTSGKKPAFEAVMKALLAAGARSNYQALVGAARTGSPAMIEMLAKAGADVNEVSRWGTALILAAVEKRIDTTEALLRVGADPYLRLPADHRNYPGQTALDAAKKAKATKVIPILEAALAGQSPAPVAAKSLEDVSKLWKRIAKALKIRPAVKKSLAKGADEKRIAACEAALGVEFPLGLREVYRLHDGQKSKEEGLFAEEFAYLDSDYSLLSLDEIMQEWNAWRKLAKAGQFKGQKARPDARVRSDWWNPKWVPFATNGGGDSLCIDLAPAKGGVVGQVIVHRHDDEDRTRIANGIHELFHQLAEHLEEMAEGEE